ncbi:MAG: single-stranded-DNA-specific exonuclease RecJ, partial [Bacillota bacterium]|nr:single-stranded-DNA-specific exonuclease RecJ [Bacillota bacterium]
RNNKELIREILKNRGIVSDEDIEEYLSDKPKETYDPFLLDSMREGVDSLISEINAGGTICIYGDYDADGVTSTCVMLCGITRLTDKIFYYIPSRFDEGYGLNTKAIDRIKERGATMILTVDCGCVSYTEVEYAKSIGLKVIVTDHHNIEDKIADCIVIDPKKPVNFRKSITEDYPCRDLAGCGVAFKFIQALQRQANLPKDVLNEALDMVAIGTIGDIVNLRGENRTLVKYGLIAANSGRRKSLVKLANAISIDGINSENVAFAIVPHINATGRMEEARIAVELFTSKDDMEIQSKVDKLISCNNERKRVQEKAYEECLEYVDENDDFIILNLPNMHEGIAGIVAGKVKDKFNRPVIIVTPTEDGDLKGTGRSIPKIDIYEILNKNSELFKRFGGHKSACGFLMDKDNYQKLVEGIHRETRTLFEGDHDLFEKALNVDLELEAGEVSVELAKDLRRLAPFGEGNPSPKFIIKDVRIDNLSYMGAQMNHARFRATPTGTSHWDGVNCVLFRKAKERAADLESNRCFNIIGSLNYQVWRGQEKVQFFVEDIRDAN